MKVLHLVPLHIPAGGIVQQAITEERAARRAGLDWHVRLFTDIDLPSEAEALRIIAVDEIEPSRTVGNWVRHAIAKVQHRRALYKWIRHHHHEYDVILLRYTTSDFARAGTLHAVSTPIVSVHHTLEEPELRTNSGLQRVVRVASEQITARRNLRAAAAIAGVTEEIVAYEKQRAGENLLSLTFPNGLNLPDYAVAEDSRASVPEVLFVASTFASWHGLDLLLADMAGTSDDFVLHLVGDVSERDARVAGRDSRIRLHGRLPQEQIAPLVATAWVGLSSFALERKGMKQACTLKVREYLAYGLSTYSGHSDVFPPDAPYYRQGPARMHEILEYAQEVRHLSREDVRAAAASLIDKASVLRSTNDRLLELRAELT